MMCFVRYMHSLIEDDAMNAVLARVIKADCFFACQWKTMSSSEVSFTIASKRNDVLRDMHIDRLIERLNRENRINLN
jgi:hypothetical protein